jgi:hypothetical protein
VSAYRKFIDTLQSEPWTPTPSKPPKAPKANPGRPVSLPVLGGLGTLGAAPLKVENTGHTSAQPCVSYSARFTGSGIEGEHPVNGEDGSDMPLVGGAIVAPVKWVEHIALRASSEPGFSEPWPPRCGRVEWQGDTLLHFCSVCGAWGSYGFGVNLRDGSMGRWFCAAHRSHGGQRVANDADGRAAGAAP